MSVVTTVCLKTQSTSKQHASQAAQHICEDSAQADGLKPPRLQRRTNKVGIAAIRKTLRQKPTIAAIEARIHPAPGATRPVAFGMKELARAEADQVCRAPGNLGNIRVNSHGQSDH